MRKKLIQKEFELAREIKLNDSKKNILKKLKLFKFKNYESVYIKFKGFKFEFKEK